MLKFCLLLFLSWVIVGCSERNSSLTSSTNTALGVPPVLRVGVEPPMVRDPVTGEFVLRVNTEAPIVRADGQDFE